LTIAGVPAGKGGGQAFVGVRHDGGGAEELTRPGGEDVEDGSPLSAPWLPKVTDKIIGQALKVRG
jgi:hypothetical protein